ncbi:hypothetical protein B0H17DRAFT_1148216 [Mycena rosella]|uniref:CCHC-type domain-containing protein n=1 Tax=Mycena rosella TaxID=1033263 RepID=A0AAD7FYA3_MYCRO|nr:hypothetical protein B0H17DRAFT_1148216 [Mycena rosella]
MIPPSAKAALIATNIVRSVAAAAQASGTAPAVGMTISSGNTASAQTITLAPVYLMHLAVEEWDHLEAEKKKHSTSLRSHEDTGVALNTQPMSLLSSSLHKQRFGRSGKGNGNGNGNQRQKGLCWNCGGKGHVSSKCPSPKLESEKGKGGAWSVEPMECIDRTRDSASLCIAADTVFDVEDLSISIPLTINSREVLPESDNVALCLIAHYRIYLRSVEQRCLEGLAVIAPSSSVVQISEIVAREHEE